jgi:hypothetical protein
MGPAFPGTTMASESKKTKTESVSKDAAPKAEVAAKVESTAAEAAPKSEGGETAAKPPANYSRGEGQKPVTAAYKENWNAIFAKKKTKKKKR